MIPVILCGGAGARLWPISEKKPFYNFFNDHSFLETSLKRLKSFEPFLIVSVEKLKPAMEEILRKTRYKSEIIYEPESKNTAVSIALICHLLSKKQQNKEIVGIFPSDHFIEKESDFQKLISTGIQIAKEEQKIVTFGIPPHSPCSDYGYIKVQDTYRELNKISIKQAVGFVEKPHLSKSLSLVNEGYLWNSGIFLSPVDLLIQYFEKYLPELWEQILCIKEDNIHSVYKNIKPVSFDKGIMENISQYICLPCDVGWSDLGSWDRMSDLDRQFPKMLNNKSHIVSRNSNDNFVFSSTDKHIGLIGLKNILVVNGEEGLLITKKGSGGDVRYISEEFKKQDIEQNKKWIEKPWGAYRVVMEEGFFKYKEIKVNPGHQLSYQSHKKRKEHWLVISGIAEVTIEGNKYQLKANEHIFIDRRVKHRLKNQTEEQLLLLEIQMGNYLEEDDITRYEDDYGRS